MLFLTHMALLLLFGFKDAVSRKSVVTPEVIKARLGEPLTLDCKYNCSSGFVRGDWKWEDSPACGSCLWTPSRDDVEQSSNICTVKLTTPNLTLEQTLYNYSCLSVKIDDQLLPLKTERLISLQIQDETTAPVTSQTMPLDISMKVNISTDEMETTEESSQSIQVPLGTQLKMACFSTIDYCEGKWMRDQGNLSEASPGPLLQFNNIREEDGGSYTCHAKQLCTSHRITVLIEVIKNDEFGWIRILAALTLSVATILVVVLIYLCYKRKSTSSDSEDPSAVIYENTRAKNEATVLKPIVQDLQSDHEVPYADIVISVRGSSIPELTGTHSQTPRDHRLRWREEAGGSRLHGCRSADRLHVHPREVSRKLSTTSEYAIITYSTEALG